jgi:hypothetical protein
MEVQDEEVKRGEMKKKGKRVRLETEVWLVGLTSGTRGIKTCRRRRNESRGIGKVEGGTVSWLEISKYL